MKKTICVTTVLILFFTLSPIMTSASDKKISVFGAAGMASAPFDELLIDLGVDFQLTGGLYAEFMVNTHIGESDYNGFFYDSFNYNGDYFMAESPTVLHGVTANFVYKIPLSRRLKFFGKIGAGYLFYSRVYPINEYNYTRNSNDGLDGAIGGGFELFMNERTNLIIGSSYEFLLNRDTTAQQNETSWIKFYIGANFFIKN